MKKTCPGCKKEFELNIQPGPKRKFCSRKCQLEVYFASRNKPGVPRGKAADVEEIADLSPASWAASVFRDYELSEGEKQLVFVGLEALVIARDREEEWKLRNQAMGRFQSILAQLNLPKLEEEEKVETAPVVEPVRASKPSIDPRAQLRVVS